MRPGIVFEGKKGNDTLHPPSYKQDTKKSLDKRDSPRIFEKTTNRISKRPITCEKKNPKKKPRSIEEEEK